MGPGDNNAQRPRLSCLDAWAMTYHAPVACQNRGRVRGPHAFPEPESQSAYLGMPCNLPTTLPPRQQIPASQIGTASGLNGSIRHGIHGQFQVLNDRETFLITKNLLNDSVAALFQFHVHNPISSYRCGMNQQRHIQGWPQESSLPRQDIAGSAFIIQIHQRT